MVKNYLVQAIVLKRKNIRETDKIVTLFSKQHGKITAIVKGIRKIHSKKAPHLEIFNHVNVFLVSARNLDIITEAQTIETYVHTRKNIEKIAYAYKMVEQIDRLCPERVPFYRLFYLIINTLHIIDSNDPGDVNKLVDKFTLALLQELGYLSNKQVLEGKELEGYFEQLIERKLLSTNLLNKVQTTSYKI
jgi:DNA repair protein RecO (recombination protein O)